MVNYVSSFDKDAEFVAARELPPDAIDGLSPNAIREHYAQHEISLEICRLYANGNCPHCLARGYSTYSFPEFDKDLHQTVNVVSWGDYCVCVKKNLKKKRGGDQHIRRWIIIK